MTAITDETYWYKLEYKEDGDCDEYDRFYKVTFHDSGKVTETFLDEEDRTMARNYIVYDNIKEWKKTFDSIKSRPKYIKSIRFMTSEEAEAEMVLEFI